MYRAVFKHHAELLKALANPKRLEVVQLLRQGRLTVSNMERMLGIKQANLSQHLMVLRRIGVVTTERRGKKIYYQLAHVNFARASDLMRIVLMQRMGKRAASAVRVLRVVTDPVCAMKLTPATAASYYHKQGRNYFFCGSGCAKEFRKKI